MDNLVMSLENWKAQLELENESLRNTVVGLQAEVCGARLAARYLDKELAGRIQQLQLLGRSDMSGDARDRLWSQLEAEILVQRQKTVVRAVRQRDSRAPPPSLAGAVRTVRLNRHPHQGLGVSIPGGREHGVPILISELEPGGGAVVAGGGGQLFVGDAVLSVNGIDLRQASHQEAVNVLSGQVGAVTLTLQYLAGNDVESDDDNDFNNLRYGFFDDANDGVDFYRTTNGYSQNNSKDRPATPTPTAPRTPDSLIRGESECSYPTSPIASHKDATNCNTDDRGTNNEEPAATAERSVHISTTEPQLSAPPAVVSPKHFGVTTLQKIFRSLTPSGVWSDGTEEESNDNNETGDDEKSPTAGDNRLNLSDDVTSPEAATKSVNNINDNIEEIILRQGGTSIVAQRMLPSNRKGVDGVPRWREQLQKESSQLFHPETEAVSLVDGHGDATFGTPV
ncbi:hypothetical protein LSTR_LSTR011971 [Laodelphax striatellus]|uniref:PDZ domain-containing protein n=1 Tax=Laodelphax striatellus TaxID=195883 RepID=A0A482WRU2_LAOST|nr:hypothetical protein LSTR_LSTR011971 [Laodelphax striatellus]